MSTASGIPWDDQAHGSIRSVPTAESLRQIDRDSPPRALPDIGTGAGARVIPGSI